MKFIRNVAPADWSILLLRVCIGMMMIFPHGWAKMINFSTMAKVFPSILGSSMLTLIVAIFCEVVCQIMIILGIKVRWFSIPPMIMMAVAAVLVHAGDSWHTREKAILYAVCYAALAISKGGKLAVRD